MVAKSYTPLFVSVAVIIVLALIQVFIFIGYTPFQLVLNPFSPDHPGLGQCFSPASVRDDVPCARCVHFVTVAMNSSRWGFGNKLSRSARFSTGAVRASHACFTLHLYTNVRRNSSAWSALAKAGGENVTIVEYPLDLPKNAYSGKDEWIELSRRKLDLLERYERQYGRKAIWVDLDTIVATDLSCAYARAPHFIVSRPMTGRSLKGPGGVVVNLHPKRTVYGDLFMLDSKLIQAVRNLEASGMPPPMYDLQDYFSFLLNRCDGNVIDLRALVRADGFRRGGPMCFGFDFSQQIHPDPDVVELKMAHERLHCGIRANGRVKYYPAGALSFVAAKFWRMLNESEEFFRTPEVMNWAKGSGLD